MAGHYPFSGRANRVGVFAFFEKNALGLDLQEKYYKWWYDWAKAFVAKDPDLSVTKAPLFNHYPIGQHAHNNFHLHDYVWATPMLELGEFVRDIVMPRMSEDALHKLEHDHHKMLDKLLAERTTSPRTAPPDVGRYRHV
jgi:hypothetical protein